VYSRLEVIAGRSVELLCNTSLTSDTMWSYDNDDDGYVDYVYRHTNRPRLFIKPTGDSSHVLFISDAQTKDTGVYDCYDEQGKRKVGYRLSIAGMRSTVMK